jgi:prepilin-type N-terminal cleavage/methylation domain-containing protein
LGGAEETSALRELVLTERFVRQLSFGRTNKKVEGTIQMENKQDKGFTLVELLIVIVILGILATITVFAVRGITDQGQTSACSADQKTMQTAVEAYFAQNGIGTDPDPAALVAGGLLVEVSSNYTISGSADPAGDGTVASTLKVEAIANGKCDVA